MLETTETKPKTKMEGQKLERSMKIQSTNFVKTSTMTQSYKQQHLKGQSIICSEPST